MKRFVAAAVVLVSAFAACGGKISSSTDGGEDGSANQGCCDPSPTPGCCMSYGGWSTTLQCAAVCDGMPTPNTPGWTLVTDSHGCKVWQQPSNATNYCGGILVDASPPPPPPPTCPTPADVSQWTPPGFTPPVVKKGSCTSQQLQDFFNACFSSNNNQTQCSSFEQANPTCTSCVLTKPQTPGPLIETSNALVMLNVPGCIAIVTGDSSPSSCAARLQTAEDCVGAACDAQCPVSDTQSFQQYMQCSQTASSGECGKYVQAECALDGGTPAQCDVVDFQTGYMNIAPLFCGP